MCVFIFRILLYLRCLDRQAHCRGILWTLCHIRVLRASSHYQPSIILAKESSAELIVKLLESVCRPFCSYRWQPGNICKLSACCGRQSVLRAGRVSAVWGLSWTLQWLSRKVEGCIYHFGFLGLLVSLISSSKPLPGSSHWHRMAANNEHEFKVHKLISPVYCHSLAFSHLNWK